MHRDKSTENQVYGWAGEGVGNLEGVWSNIKVAQDVLKHISALNFLKSENFQKWPQASKRTNAWTSQWPLLSDGTTKRYLKHFKFTYFYAYKF